MKKIKIIEYNPGQDKWAIRNKKNKKILYTFRQRLTAINFMKELNNKVMSDLDLEVIPYGI